MNLEAEGQTVLESFREYRALVTELLAAKDRELAEAAQRAAQDGEVIVALSKRLSALEKDVGGI